MVIKSVAGPGPWIRGFEMWVEINNSIYVQNINNKWNKMVILVKFLKINEIHF
jgi:hypothetical protein